MNRARTTLRQQLETGSYSVLVSATTQGPQTVSCSPAVMVYLDPEGRITVLQYALVPSGEWLPTGATITYLDAHTCSLTRACPPAPTRKLRTNVLVNSETG